MLDLILIQCRHLERLTLLSSQEMLDPRVPVLNHLTYLYLDDRLCDTNLFACYYKYRAHLTSLDLYHMVLMKDEYTSDTFCQYLGSFPELKSLAINIPLIPFGNTPMLDLIIHQCHSLNSIKYRSASLYSSASIIEYPQIHELELAVDYLHLPSVKSIQDQFVCLKKLKISVKNPIYNEEDVVQALMDIDPVDELSVHLSACFDIEQTEHISYILNVLCYQALFSDQTPSNSRYPIPI
ncbi:hypothetical protein BDB01DRAFT_454414 [Pilobolus umbonatus]|nr:hypothetical protein BDB01DRAFT_454414 [Pilobolus umbonatus]